MLYYPQKGGAFTKKLFVPLFVAVNAVLLGLGWESMFGLMSLIFSFGIDGGGGRGLFSRFALICIALAFVAFVAFVCVLLFNYNISDKLEYTPKVWAWQLFFSFALSILMIPVWEKLFYYLSSRY